MSTFANNEVPDEISSGSKLFVNVKKIFRQNDNTIFILKIITCNL